MRGGGRVGVEGGREGASSIGKVVLEVMRVFQFYPGGGVNHPGVRVKVEESVLYGDWG